MWDYEPINIQDHIFAVNSAEIVSRENEQIRIAIFNIVHIEYVLAKLYLATNL